MPPGLYMLCIRHFLAFLACLNNNLPTNRTIVMRPVPGNAANKLGDANMNEVVDGDGDDSDESGGIFRTRSEDGLTAMVPR